MTDEADVLPCPFCGSEGRTGPRNLWAYCSNLACSASDEVILLVDWNRREGAKAAWRAASEAMRERCAALVSDKAIRDVHDYEEAIRALPIAEFSK